jgi:hypothetical protein
MRAAINKKMRATNHIYQGGLMIGFSKKFLTRTGLIVLLGAQQSNATAPKISENNLISDAWCKIQKALHDEYHPKEGSPTHISCVYKLQNNTKVQEEVKTYLDGYHAKKHYATQSFNDDANPDKIIEIDYKPNSDHLSLVYRDPKRHNKCIDEKEIKISEISSFRAYKV